MVDRALDTSREARRIQETAVRSLGPQSRVRVAAELSELVRQMRLAGLREEAPGASRSELIRLFIAETYGVGLERDD